jgi:hypothetical protein
MDGVNVMSDPMALKWALIDLLKICDAAHEGRLHGDLARIARTLGVELSEPAKSEAALDLHFTKAKKAARI